jgi:membrane protein involved in colicin uptake
MAADRQAREQARKDADLQAKQAREDAKARADIMREDALARAQIKAKAEHSPGERMKAESDRVEKGRDYE